LQPTCLPVFRECGWSPLCGLTNDSPEDFLRWAVFHRRLLSKLAILEEHKVRLSVGNRPSPPRPFNPSSSPCWHEPATVRLQPRSSHRFGPQRAQFPSATPAAPQGTRPSEGPVRWKRFNRSAWANQCADRGKGCQKSVAITDERRSLDCPGEKRAFISHSAPCPSKRDWSWQGRSSSSGPVVQRTPACPTRSIKTTWRAPGAMRPGLVWPLERAASASRTAEGVGPGWCSMPSARKATRSLEETIRGYSKHLSPRGSNCIRSSFPISRSGVSAARIVSSTILVAYAGRQ